VSFGLFSRRLLSEAQLIVLFYEEYKLEPEGIEGFQFPAKDGTSVSVQMTIVIQSVTQTMLY
jgi:hypothetical protein